MTEDKIIHTRDISVPEPALLLVGMSRVVHSKSRVTVFMKIHKYLCHVGVLFLEGCSVNRCTVMFGVRF